MRLASPLRPKGAMLEKCLCCLERLRQPRQSAAGAALRLSAFSQKGQSRLVGQPWPFLLCHLRLGGSRPHARDGLRLG